MYTAFFDPMDAVDKVLIPHDRSAPGVAWVANDDLGEANANLIQEFVSNPRNEKYVNKSYFSVGLSLGRWRRPYKNKSPSMSMPRILGLLRC